MKDHSDCKRQFIHLSRAYYGPSNLLHSDIIDEITMGFYHKDGGTTGEFSIKWIKLAGREVPKLCAFDDSWDALFKFKDVLRRMAELDDENPTPEEICMLLSSCSIEDVTPTKSPYTVS
ncbi:MAG: hypothetical protein WC055_01085 [Melioribacteraceae bacterium]